MSSGYELMVLCGGRGKRLNPVTESIPKALVPVRGRPIVDHVVEKYRKGGVDRITYCIGYKGQQVRDHFSAACEAGADYHFSDSGEGASMLRRIYDAGCSMKRDSFIIAYCDTFIDLPPDELMKRHKALGTVATIVTAGVVNPFGIIDLGEDDKVRSFVEKPRQNYFIGTLAMEREALDLVDETLLSMPDGQGLVAFFHKLIELGQLGAYRHEGLQITFNTEEERAKAETTLHHYYTVQDN